MLSVATSIDALAVGLSLAMLRVGIWYPILIIGVVTFGLTVLGMLIGSRIGSRFGRWTEFFGGVVLIGIGLKILVEHLA
jgi:putative Mn2+ efflux pump MntP